VNIISFVLNSSRGLSFGGGDIVFSLTLSSSLALRPSRWHQMTSGGPDSSSGRMPPQPNAAGAQRSEG